jgi:hypothetical protein
MPGGACKRCQRDYRLNDESQLQSTVIGTARPDGAPAALASACKSGPSHSSTNTSVPKREGTW